MAVAHYQAEAESTLTDRYQTTVPETVRRALNLQKRDKIHYTIRPNGEVLLTCATSAFQDDPGLESFLCFLENDFDKHPERLKMVDASFVQRIRSLTGGNVALDLDSPLLAEDE